jgi:hypothetical protein
VGANLKAMTKRTWGRVDYTRARTRGACIVSLAWGCPGCRRSLLPALLCEQLCVGHTFLPLLPGLFLRLALAWS